MLELAELHHELSHMEKFVLSTILDTTIGSLHSQLPSEKPRFLFSTFKVIVFSLYIGIFLE